jgi:hypothetical protein
VPRDVEFLRDRLGVPIGFDRSSIGYDSTGDGFRSVRAIVPESIDPGLRRRGDGAGLRAKGESR